jgi:hypothetical protein
MYSPSTVELVRWKESIASEIQELERQMEPLQRKLSELREKLKALETLTGNGNGASETTSFERQFAAKRVGSSDDETEFTAAEAYWQPILEALVERGGREHSDSVLALVEKKMAHILKPADYEILPSGGAARWRNRAQWQRQNMIQQGLLRKDSPRGIWEITPEGRRWLALRKG